MYSTVPTSARSLFTLLLITAALAAGLPAAAQNTQNNGQNGPTLTPRSSNFNLPRGMERFYYVDQLGMKLAPAQLAQEGAVNKTNYQLGPGDLISIDYEGGLSGSMRGLLVNPQGDVSLPGIGTVPLEGLNIEEAGRAVMERVQQNYKDTRVTVSLERPRLVTIHINGEIPFPGRQQVYPFTRLDQAIYPAFFSPENAPKNLAGGIPFRYQKKFLDSRKYALRDIRIRRKSGKVIHADLIAYFYGGDLSANPFIHDGDVISIYDLSPEAPRVSISGAVQSEKELEFAPGDTPASLIDIAGGRTVEADTSRIWLFRRSGEEIKKMAVNNAHLDDYRLQPNDRVVVPMLHEKRTSSSAWVEGEAQNPGNFPIINGETTAKKLLEMAGGTNMKALPDAAFLVRANYDQNDIPGQFNPDLLKRTSNQYAQGLEYLDLETKVSKNRVHIDLTDPDQLANVRIYDGDRLFIPHDEHTVFVFGQVNNPGYYPYQGGLKSARDFIRSAGGFSLSADTKRLFVIKAGSKTWHKPDETDIESGDMIFVDRVPVEDLNAKRSYDLQVKNYHNNNIRLVMAGISTITGIITTYVAVTR